MEEIDEAVFEDGLGFDGSSIRGWKAINASDMLVMPDPATFKMDPFITEAMKDILGDHIHEHFLRAKRDGRKNECSKG